MSDSSVLKFGRIDTGFVVRVEGRGTMHQSPAVHDFVSGTLEREPGATVVLDLAFCGYLDSTFLGCLVTLHKRFAQAAPARFVISASAEKRSRLLAATRLDRFLNLTDSQPPCPREWSTLSVPELGQRALGRHSIECHRNLAELGGPDASRFELVADLLARELGAEP